MSGKSKSWRASHPRNIRQIASAPFEGLCHVRLGMRPRLGSCVHTCGLGEDYWHGIFVYGSNVWSEVSESNTRALQSSRARNASTSISHWRADDFRCPTKGPEVRKLGSRLAQPSCMRKLPSEEDFAQSLYHNVLRIEKRSWMLSNCGV